MSNRELCLTGPSGDPALSVVVPILERLERHVQAIGLRVDEVVPRRPITESTKELHRQTVLQLGGRCPCCLVIPVLDGEGSVIGEFDHFYSRERNAFEETWLICRPCHLRMRDRAMFTDEFRSYQRRAAAIESGQLRLL